MEIAETGVDTLDRWHQYFEPDEIKPLLKTVLPYLDPYLRSRGFTGDAEIKSPFSKPKSRKLQMKLHYETESELLKVQRKILMFIGQLDTETSLYLVKNKLFIEEVPWEIQPSLNFAVPFEDVKSIVYLDKIVPRIIELSLNSSDRKTRISACEVLHGTFVVLLSKSTQIPDDDQYKYMFRKLFKTMIKPVVLLGCDSDEPVRQIFNEFVSQLIHWYTSSAKIAYFESEILADTIMENVSHPTNTSLREFSGKCINEYVDWSIKQYKTEDTARIYKNIKIIVQKICSYCLHPSSHKRYGAALAFNNIYRKLREEQSMVDRFWIELLYYFILNLSTKTEKINAERNSLEISKTLGHIERVFKEEKILFNQCGYRRKVPDVIAGPFLKDVSLWILKNTGSDNAECRQKCMALFCGLTRCVENSPRIFLDKHVEKTWYVDIYEKNFENISTDNFKGLNEFLDGLSRCFDGYIWIFEMELIDFNEIKTEKLFGLIDFYVTNFSKLVLNDTLNKNEIFNVKKREITQKLFILIQKIMVVKNDLPFLDNFWNFFTICIFEPQLAGFNALNNLEMEKLTENNINMLNKCNYLPEKQLGNLKNCLSNYFNDKYLEYSNLENIHVGNVQRQLLKGFVIVQKSKLKDKIQLSKPLWNIRKIFENVIKGNDGLILTSTAFSYLELQLEVAVYNKNVSELWNCIMDDKEITELDTFSTWKAGEYFLNRFKNILLPFLAQNSSEIVANFFKIPKKPSSNNGGDVMMEVFKYLSENRRNVKINCSKLVKEIMQSSQKYFEFDKSMTSSERLFQVEFLGHIAKLLQENEPLYKLSEDFTFLKNWYILSLLLPEDHSTSENTRQIFEFKIKLLSILPCFTGPSDDSNAPLL